MFIAKIKELSEKIDIYAKDIDNLHIELIKKK